MDDRNETQKTTDNDTNVGHPAAAAAAVTIVPRRVLGGPGYQAPSDTLNIAGVGVGGMGAANLRKVTSENIVALADIDWQFAAPVFKEYPEATLYKDYRRMLDEMGRDIDGVIVATPDHTHAVITKDAMQMGKHVYVQKPLTWSVYESRYLRELADRTGVVTQMGNQGHSSDDARLVNEYIRDGAIGDVHTVHVWTDRPIWPQNVEHPELTPEDPSWIDWDVFLGPARYRRYSPAYHPFSWRGWVDYGTGALGDMGAHTLDHPYWALELDAPTSVETRSTSFNGESWPHATVTYYNFGAEGSRPPVTIIWYDGGLMPPHVEGLPEDEVLGSNGALFVGEEGVLLHDIWGQNPRIYPEERGNYEPPRLFERIPGGPDGHEMNWVRSIKEGTQATSHFDYAARLTETMLLGLVSLRAGNRKIEWDADACCVSNLEEANQYLHRDPRPGWALNDRRV